MGPIKKFVSIVLVFSFLVFVALFGRLPALRNTPIGFLHRLLVIRVPRFIYNVDLAVSGGRITSGSVRLFTYLMNENHPVVLIFFLSLLTSAACFFLYHGWSRLSSVHHILIPPVLSLPYIFTYLSATSTASYVTPSNHHTHMRIYPYDHVLYKPGARCRTCLFQKPARSKHCSICKVCIAKHDHHCIWVSNCLGKNNYRWFLGLLSSMALVLAYATFLSYTLLVASVSPRKSGLSALFDAWTVAIIEEIGIGAVAMLSLMTLPLPTGLFFYHMYLIWAGMTTNETNKWSDWKADMDDGLVFKGEAVRPHGPNALEPPTSWPVASNQILAICHDGKAPSDSETNSGNGVVNRGKVHWQRCWSLEDVTNIYDLGFWDNMRDVFNIL